MKKEQGIDKLIIKLIISLFVLSSCGGGGGGSSESSADVPSNSSSNSSSNSTPINSAPDVGALNIIFSTNEDTSKSMNLGFPTDKDNDTLTIYVDTYPAIGSITAPNRVIAKGDSITTNEFANLSYSPPDNFNDVDGLQGIFILKVSDGTTSVDKNITIKVTPVNDEPTVTIDDSYYVQEGTQAVTTIAVTDIEGDIITYSLDGSNQNLFSIDSAGNLKFLAAPSGTNDYILGLIVSDGTSQVQKNINIETGPWSPSVLEVSGKVIDGYIQNARVFIDVNFDGVWSGSADYEPSVLTNNVGGYQFDSAEYATNKACYDRRPRIAIVDENAYDVSLGAITKPYKLVFMPNIEWMANSTRGADDSINTNLTPYTSVSQYLISKAKDYLNANCTENCDELKKELIAINQTALPADQCAATSTSSKIANAVYQMAQQERGWMNDRMKSAGLPVVNAGSNQVISSGYDFIDNNNASFISTAEKMANFLTLIQTLNTSLDTYFEGVYGNGGNLVGIDTKMNAETVKELLTANSFIPLSADILYTGDTTINGWEWKDEMTINRLKGTLDAKLTQGSCEKLSETGKCGELNPSQFSNIIKSAASVKLNNTWEKNSAINAEIDDMYYREIFNAWWGVDENCEGTCATEPNNPERIVATSDTYHCSESSSIGFSLSSNQSGNVYAIQDFDASLGCPVRDDKVKRLMWNYNGDSFTFTRTDGVEKSEGAYDGIHIRLYNEGQNTDISMPVVDKSQRNPQIMIDWIAYAKTLPNHWSVIADVKALFRANEAGGNTDNVTFTARRLIDGKNMMHELIISNGGEDTCIKQDRTDYSIAYENVIVERVNGEAAYNACFGTFTSLK